MRKILAVMALSLALFAAACFEDKSTLDVSDIPLYSTQMTHIVPWGDSGGTAHSFRAVEEHLTSEMGIPAKGLFKPGDAGFEYSEKAATLPANGQWALWGALKTLETWKLKGRWDYGLDEWEAFIVWEAPAPIISVPVGSKYKSIQEVLAAFNSDDLVIHTAGPNSSGDIAVRSIAKLLGATKLSELPKQVAASSGTDASVDGAFDSAVVISYYSEQKGLIDSGDLTPLASVSSQDAIYGNLVIPALSDTLSRDIPSQAVAFGFVMKKDSPNIDKVKETWLTVKVDKAAAERSTIPRVVSGDEAMQILKEQYETDKWASELN